MILSHLNGSDNGEDEDDEAADDEAARKARSAWSRPNSPSHPTPISPVGAVVPGPASPETDGTHPETPRPGATGPGPAFSADQRPRPAAPTPPKSDHVSAQLGAGASDISLRNRRQLKSPNDPEIALTNVPTPLPESCSRLSMEPLDPLPRLIERPPRHRGAMPSRHRAKTGRARFRLGCHTALNPAAVPRQP